MLTMMCSRAPLAVATAALLALISTPCSVRAFSPLPATTTPARASIYCDGDDATATSTTRRHRRVLATRCSSSSKGDDDDLDDYGRINAFDVRVDRRSVVASGAAAIGAAFVSASAASPLAAQAAMTKKRGGGGIKSKFPTWTLEGGVKMPVLALNTVGLSADDTTRALSLAVPLGFSHVDFHPGKERDGVAAFLKSDPSRRSKLFLNTKIRKPPPGTSPSDAAALCANQIEEDLGVLGVDGVDMLMLRDSPDCAVIQAQWAVLEDALRQGKTRSVGVINYCESALKCVLETAEIKPALNYYMLHAGMGRDPRGLRSYGEKRGVRTFAYGAVGEPGPLDGLLDSPVLRRIGEAHGGRGAEEVALRYVLQTGAAVSVRPTAEFGLGASRCEGDDGARRCTDGLTRRAGAFDWSLTTAEMKELDALTGPGLDQNPTLFSSAGCPDAFVMPAKK